MYAEVDQSGLTQVVIDVEYAGNEARIKEHLVNLLRRAGDIVKPDQIRFDRVGRKSAAHRLALETFRGENKPDLVLTEGDLLGQFR